MEHSLLHGLILFAVIIVVGGPTLILGLLQPALKVCLGGMEDSPLVSALRLSATKWVFRGAVVGVAAITADLFVQVAEVNGSTVFAGVDLAETTRFAISTMSGQMALAKIAVFIAIAIVAGFINTGKWWWTALLSAVAIVLIASVSHAAAQPTNRNLAITVQIAHITGAAVWIGTLFHLLAARTAIEQASTKQSLAILAQMIRRFSPIALTIVSVLLLSGVLAASRFVGNAPALVDSAYGLTLLVKLGLLVPALYAGLLNHSVIRPQLIRKQSLTRVKPLLASFGRNLELEVTAGLLVLAVAGILAAISPPGENASLQLSAHQTELLLSPRLPSLSIPDPNQFYGAAQRTLADLRYSEFTHHSSGIFVCLLGLFWLLQTSRNRLSRFAGNLWPLLLLPFAMFIAVAADPEVWWLRRVSLATAISDPQLFEHQLGAGMVVAMAWLGRRDRERPVSKQPLGYALPVIFIIGSLLLLGHAHSTLNATDSLLNLINVQHAVFGAFGLFAGVTRWFSLRGLLSDRIARRIWPSLVIGLGLFMTFCYREIV